MMGNANPSPPLFDLHIYVSCMDRERERHESDRRMGPPAKTKTLRGSGVGEERGKGGIVGGSRLWRNRLRFDVKESMGIWNPGLESTSLGGSYEIFLLLSRFRYIIHRQGPAKVGKR